MSEPPNYEKSEKELNELPIEWERHESCDKWAVMEIPSGVPITYYMSARTYSFKGQQHTIKAAPEFIYKNHFTEQNPTRVPFGKYEGHSIAWIVENDYDYAEWLSGIADDWLREPLDEELDQDWEQWTRGITLTELGRT